jgi:DNA-binding MarR family transcriptional regulator
MQSLQPTKCAARLAAQLLAVLGVAQRNEPRVVELAAELDISLSQIRALVVLYRAEQALSLGTLASGVGLSDAAAVRMVDGLLRHGLVVRREDEHDRRVKRISLSAAGHEAIQGLAAAKRASLEQFAMALMPDELDRLIAALDPIVARLDLQIDIPVAG